MTDRCERAAAAGEREIALAAGLFRALGSEARLALVRLLAEEPRTVARLVEATGMSQPLVSQHLRTLREAGVVASEPLGRERRYRLEDDHVAHVVADALVHAAEGPPGPEDQAER